MKWQPIETAPKDGTTWVLVFYPEGIEPLKEVWFGQVSEERYQTEKDRVLVTGPGRDGEHYGWYPTHWMPLPKSPEADILKDS